MNTTLFWKHFKLSDFSFENSISQLVVNCLLVSSDSFHDIICQRFHCVALLKKMCVKRAVCAVTKIIYVMNILSGHFIKDLWKNMSELLWADERYSLLIKKFEIDCLVVLKQHMTCSMYVLKHSEVCYVNHGTDERNIFLQKIKCMMTFFVNLRSRIFMRKQDLEQILVMNFFNRSLRVSF